MASEVRRLYRSRTKRLLGGVCGGLGEYFAIDPTLIRVGFAALAFASGVSLIAYLLLLIVVPIEPPPPGSDLQAS
jgi:phage shock protein PspC (stress-responsive transcriptional regulator)